MVFKGKTTSTRGYFYEVPVGNIKKKTLCCNLYTWVMVLLTQKGSDMGIVLVSLRGIVLKPSWIWKSWNIDLDIISASGQLSCIWGEMTPWSGTLVSFVPFSFRLWTLFHSFCNLLINKGVKRSRFARYDSMQHHVYASHMYTYIRYRYCFLWTLLFLKIWIHFLITDATYVIPPITWVLKVAHVRKSFGIDGSSQFHANEVHILGNWNVADLQATTKALQELLYELFAGSGSLPQCPPHIVPHLHFNSNPCPLPGMASHGIN